MSTAARAATAEVAAAESDRAARIAAAGPDAALTPADIEREFLIPAGTLASHRARGTGPAYVQLGRSRAPRYLRRDILAWIEACRVRPGGGR